MLKIAVPTNRPQAVVNYLDALAQLGARGETGRCFDPSEYDGLLLPGGVDVNPSRYGKERIPQETVDDDLDALQFETLEKFLAAGIPVFGICRGHQLLNVAFGGSLIQHLPCAEKHMSLPTREDNVHRTLIEQGSFMHRIYGAECTVNSSHHQGIERPGKGLKAVMHSEDGVIEAWPLAGMRPGPVEAEAADAYYAMPTGDDDTAPVCGDFIEVELRPDYKRF